MPRQGRLTEKARKWEERDRRQREEEYARIEAELHDEWRNRDSSMEPDNENDQANDKEQVTMARGSKCPQCGYTLVAKNEKNVSIGTIVSYECTNRMCTYTIKRFILGDKH